MLYESGVADQPLQRLEFDWSVTKETSRHMNQVATSLI